MRMKLETEVMREKRRKEKQDKALEFVLRMFGMILAFVSGMTFMVMVTNAEAKGAGVIWAISFVGAIACWAVGEPT